LRDKARAAGIDLSQPFFFPPSTSDMPRSSASSSRSARRALLASAERKRNPGTRKQGNRDTRTRSAVRTSGLSSGSEALALNRSHECECECEFAVADGLVWSTEKKQDVE
jgi:hypothetical protein